MPRPKRTTRQTPPPEPVAQAAVDELFADPMPTAEPEQEFVREQQPVMPPPPVRTAPPIRQRAFRAPVALPSLQQLADKFRSAPMGIVCPRCGSPTGVTNTRKYDREIVRYRVCFNPNCQTHFRTEER
jgi:hypothetical protein